MTPSAARTPILAAITAASTIATNEHFASRLRQGHVGPAILDQFEALAAAFELAESSEELNDAWVDAVISCCDASNTICLANPAVAECARLFFGSPEIEEEPATIEQLPEWVESEGKHVQLDALLRALREISGRDPRGIGG